MKNQWLRKNCRAAVSFFGIFVCGIAACLPVHAQGTHSVPLIQTFQTQAKTLKMSMSDYQDRVQGVWVAQMAAAIMGFRFEHHTASVEWVDQLPKPMTSAPVDDDWYYEMAAIRAFEKYGIHMSIQQLGQQWKDNACGSWGSSEQARLLLDKGIVPPATGHPRPDAWSRSG